MVAVSAFSLHPGGPNRYPSRPRQVRARQRHPGTAQRILGNEAEIQDEAVNAAQQSLTVTTNQYRAGIVSYLNVIVAQTIAFNNQRTAVDILGRQLNASVLLIKALGGGWSASKLPSNP